MSLATARQRINAFNSIQAIFFRQTQPKFLSGGPATFGERIVTII